MRTVARTLAAAWSVIWMRYWPAICCLQVRPTIRAKTPSLEDG